MSKATVLQKAPRMYAQFYELEKKFTEAYEIEFQKIKTEKFEIVYVYGDDFYIVETTNSKPFFVSTNCSDPDDHRTHAELLEAMKDFILNSEGDLETKDGLISVRPEHYYGKYTDTLLEAVQWAIAMHDLPVTDWDKEYNQPVNPFL